MPVVGVKRDLLFEKLGKEYTEEEFDALCFDYGIELDDVLSEKDMVRKELHKDGEEAAEASDDIIYKIDIPANRYDMLCVEGIARALNIFRRTMPSPRYTLADMTGKMVQQMVVKPETALVRPFVVCAILRGVKLNSERYASFIDLQDKLHQNLCRHRTLVAIGTHDLATVQGPFSYEALPPEAISFVPLKQTEEFRADRLLDYYLENDAKLKKYVPIIKGSVVYPVIYDAKRTVLSLPPIINGAHSAITTATRDVFIECTATDLTKANIVLNIVCTMFSEYCDKPFQVEPVEVVDALGNSVRYPEMSCRTMEVPVETVNRTIGVKLEGSHIAKLLSKMQLTSHLSGSGGSMVQVEVPPTRSDVLHACDIVEDVAIAYGYNNIQKTIPATVTDGRELPLNQLTELLRQECAMAGWTEILTWALVSKAEAFDMMRVEDDGTTAVEIGNPATAEFEVCRTKLLPSALKTLAANKSAALPLRLFEISDVIELDAESSTGARNKRRLVALTCSKESGFEVIHGLLNRVMDVLGVPLAGSNPDLERRFLGGYEWQECSLPTFFPGRQATVLLNAREVGTFGVVHPQVLANFDIDFPVSALELNIEPFCFDQSYQPLTTQFHD